MIYFASTQIQPEIVADISSEDRWKRLVATVKLRRLLQRRPASDVVQPVIDSHLVQPIVDMLSDKELKFQSEAAWIVSNIASGTSAQTSTVVVAGAVPKVVAMFPCSDVRALDNALWALGNIGGDSVQFRNIVIAAGGVKVVLDVLAEPEKRSDKILDTAAWVMSCFLTPMKGADLSPEIVSVHSFCWCLPSLTT